ncbi:MAG: hypothetical protein NDJ92_12690 [Thermoanaerobaculia bacterium]|nr:hypothetical protein [Thermoanaerobaculia bacterium]
MNQLTLRNTALLSLLVPIQSNDGDQFDDHTFEALETHVTQLAGGISRLGDVVGSWLGPNGIQREVLRRYEVTVPIEDAASVARELDRYVRNRFRQHAVYITETPTRSVEF